jgi:ATP-binding cassette subfamily C exporter for protease/lipase
LHTLGLLFGLLLWTLGLMEWMSWLRTKLLRQCGQAFDDALRVRVFNASARAQLLQGSSSWTQPMQDLRTLRDMFNSPALTAVMEMPLVLVFVLLLYWIHPLMALLALLVTFFQGAAGVWFMRRVAPEMTASQQDTTKSEALADSLLRNNTSIAAMDMFGAVQARWQKLHFQALLSGLGASRHSLGLVATTRGLQMLLGSALLGLGAWFLLANELSGGAAMMIVSSTLGGRVLAPFSQLILHGRTLVIALSAHERLSRVLGHFEVDMPAMSLPAPQGHLSVEGLSGGPPGVPAALLRGLQFEVLAGEMLVVLGPSGSGKSTLTRMLLGIWPALSGKVRLDGADIAVWSKDELGPWLGYVPQTIALVEGTLLDNLTRFNPPPAAEVRAGLQALPPNWLGFVDALPQSWQTQLCSDGRPLSVGQRQRLAIARAFHGEPRLVVLDEPNSALDELGEKDLLALLAQKKNQGCTLVVVTHRRSMLELADKVLVLDRGQQRLFGPMEDVLGQLQADGAAR